MIAMGEMPGFQLGVIGALALSVASSVAIVICNKALISTLEFPFGLSLSLSDTAHPTQFILFQTQTQHTYTKLISGPWVQHWPGQM